MKAGRIIVPGQMYRDTTVLLARERGRHFHQG
jgi:hypothetical protein